MTELLGPPSENLVPQPESTVSHSEALFESQRLLFLRSTLLFHACVIDLLVPNPRSIVRALNTLHQPFFVTRAPVQTPTFSPQSYHPTPVPPNDPTVPSGEPPCRFPHPIFWFHRPNSLFYCPGPWLCNSTSEHCPSPRVLPARASDTLIRAPNPSPDPRSL